MLNLVLRIHAKAQRKLEHFLNLQWTALVCFTVYDII